MSVFVHVYASVFVYVFVSVYVCVCVTMPGPRKVWFPKETPQALQTSSRDPPGHPQPKPSQKGWAAVCGSRVPFLGRCLKWRVWVEGVREGPGRDVGRLFDFSREPELGRRPGNAMCVRVFACVFVGGG